jgi:hypothetical protein
MTIIILQYGTIRIPKKKFNKQTISFYMLFLSFSTPSTPPFFKYLRQLQSTKKFITQKTGISLAIVPCWWTGTTGRYKAQIFTENRKQQEDITYS